MPEILSINDIQSEEYILILKAQNGEENAIHQLVVRFLPLITKLSSRFHISSSIMQREELIHAGILGLLQAVKRYSQESGCRLSTYAFSWIIGEMRKAISTSIDSTGAYPLMRKVRQVQERYEQAHGHTPTVSALAAACSISESEMAELISLAFPLRDCVDDCEFLTYQRSLSISADVEMQTDIRLALDSLMKAERQVILLRYFRDKTQTEIARILEKSQAQISKLERSALNHLKSQLT